MSVEVALRECRIRELRPTAPACVEPDATLQDAVGVMRSARTGCVLVCDGGHLKGILTERDFLNRVVGEQLPLSSPVTRIMTADPRTLRADDHLGDAVVLMDQGDYRHVPIVNEQGAVEGVITIHNIIEFLAEMFPEEVLNLPPRPDQHMYSQEGG
jgi:CBS domain-containing protein